MLNKNFILILKNLYLYYFNFIQLLNHLNYLFNYSVFTILILIMILIIPYQRIKINEVFFIVSIVIEINSIIIKWLFRCLIQVELNFIDMFYKMLDFYEITKIKRIIFLIQFLLIFTW